MATTSFMFRVNLWFFTVPEQRYVPPSSGKTLKVADLSVGDCEGEAGRRRRGAALY